MRRTSIPLSPCTCFPCHLVREMPKHDSELGGDGHAYPLSNMQREEDDISGDDIT